MREEAKALGLPAEAVEAALAEAEAAQEAAQQGEVIPIWPESVPAMQLWARVNHMWVYGPMGGRVCMRWESIAAWLQLLERATGEQTSAEALEGLAILERALVLYQREAAD